MWNLGTSYLIINYLYIKIEAIVNKKFVAKFTIK